MILLSEIITTVTYKVAETTENPTFTIPFQYIAKNHVHVFLDERELEAETQYQYLSNTQIQILLVVPSGSAVKILRETPYSEQIVEWNDGNVLLSDDMNMADLQMLFVLQEIKDPYNINVKNIEDILQNLMKAYPIPLGRFSVTEDGLLVLDTYGVLPDDNLYIDTEGHLILQTGGE